MTKLQSTGLEICNMFLEGGNEIIHSRVTGNNVDSMTHLLDTSFFGFIRLFREAKWIM